MKNKFYIKDKVVICDSNLITDKTTSFLDDFVCFGSVFRLEKLKVAENKFLTTYFANGSDGRVYKEEENVEGIYFVSVDDYKSRLFDEKVINPENKKKVDKLLKELEAFWWGRCNEV